MQLIKDLMQINTSVGVNLGLILFIAPLCFADFQCSRASLGKVISTLHDILIDV